MPDDYVVDASVIAKWFNKGETNEEEALALREAWSTGKVGLHCPALIIYEVCNSIWKNPNIESRKAFLLARLVIRLRLNFVEIDEGDSEEAMTLARKDKVTFYDSIYVALSRSRKWPLITADNDQLDMAKSHTKSIHISKIVDILSN